METTNETTTKIELTFKTKAYFIKGFKIQVEQKAFNNGELLKEIKTKIEIPMTHRQSASLDAFKDMEKNKAIKEIETKLDTLEKQELFVSSVLYNNKVEADKLKREGNKELSYLALFLK